MTLEPDGGPSGGADGTGELDGNGGEESTAHGQPRYQLDGDGRFVDVSPGFASLVGWDRESLRGEHVSTVLADGEAERYEVAVGRLREAGPLSEIELAVTLRGSTGDRLPCTLQFTGLAGDGSGWATLTTVTPQPSGSDGAASEYVRALGDVLGGDADVGVFLVDESATVQWANDTVADFFGLDREHLLGADKRRLVRDRLGESVADREAFVETALDTYDHDERAVSSECRIEVGPDRSERWVELHSQPVTDGPFAGGRIELYCDITERKRREKTLLEYESIVENVRDFAFTIDADGRVSYVSSHIEDMMDITPEGFRGEPVEVATRRVFADERDLETYLALVDDLLAGERSEGRVEAALATPTDEDRIVDIRLYSVSRGGEVELLVGMVRDITTKARQQTELEYERDLFEQLVQTAPVGITVHSADGEIVRANERAETVLGLDTEDLLGVGSADLDCTFVEADGTEILPRDLSCRRVLDTGEPVYDDECAVVRPDGEKRWLSVNAAPVRGADGSIERVVGVFVDITEHRERERELETERAFTEAILDSVPDMVYAFDTSGRFIRWNDHGLEVSGYDEDELAGKHVLDFVPDADQELIWDAIEEVYDDSVERRETRLVTKGGREIPYEFSAAPIVDEGGELFGFAGVGRDISDRKARERRLREQNERLERLNRINAVIRDIDQALVSASTRDEIERTVCERLAAADTYRFAWIGREQQTDGTIAPKATAGQADGYLDAVTDRTDGSVPRQGPVGRAHRTREIQVCQNVTDAPAFERDLIDAYDFRSVASIPIVYEDTLYGVLSVYAAEPFSFGEIEQAVLAELGETIGHAISGLQAKRALVTERVTELTVEIRDPDRFVFALSARADCTLSFEGGVFQSDGGLLYYITVDGVDADRIREVAADFEYVDHLRVVSEYDDVCVIEMQPPIPSTLETVTDHGGAITDATASDGTVTVTIELPGASDVHELLDSLEGRFDEVELRSQRETEQSVQTRHQFRETLTERFTDRQQAALEIAYYADYFDWPRGSTGEELANALDVSAPTFHKHLRLAERKLVGAILDDGRPERRD
ncbi:PAS domain S-box protein [Halorientalis salina]|uniref:PAS domain S-box protein n=1 Tax=Halorientalis salina TaxID=2932266 RepID=UPI00145F2510|nr:PAS domain S-box protein [Halorientalis salina]